jgi:glycosyltransferase involved in cell wall biosynthesis
MPNALRVTYLFESTALWGGNKVALEQAEALSDAGYHVTIVSRDSGPSWYPLKLPVISAPVLDAAAIPESDIIVGTYWPTVKAAYESGRGLAVHLCQGYEAGNIELLPQKAAIDEVYSYSIPKLTVSPHLDTFLRERFNAETYYIGQMINRDIFFPSGDLSFHKGDDSFTILVVGIFEADVKNIRTALRGISIARSRLPVAPRLVRVSPFPLTRDEREILKSDEYLFHVPYHSMGQIYRKADLFISVSKEAEGFGLPAVEAMACGVPTILSTISSYTSLDENRDYALFVDPTDDEILAGAIVKLFHDTPLRERLTRQGLAVAQKFSKDRVTKNLKAAFDAILSKDRLAKQKHA